MNEAQHPATWLAIIFAEFAITVTNGAVWLAIGQGLLLAGVSLLFGIWVARFVGLLASDAPAWETLSVGLAAGLMVLAAWWAAIWSGGRSAFTPVAIGFAIAIGLALARRIRDRVPADQRVSDAVTDAAFGEDEASRRRRRRSLVFGAFAGGVFVVAVALLYGSTLAPSPRDDIQPVEFTDVAFYAVLGRDLATTGVEVNYSPSGFSEVPGLPAQTWYHWGEIWLASAAISLFGAAPLAARYLIVLPVVLLAAATMTGTLVCRMAKTESRRAYLFGFAACLFFAPVPFIPGPFFSSWAVGLIFGITLYGLAAVAVLTALYFVVVLGVRRPTWALAFFVGSAVAFILPAHVVIALLVFLGIMTAWAIRLGRSLVADRRLPVVPVPLPRSIMTTGLAVIATLLWGTLTEHGVAGSASIGASASTLGADASSGILSFNGSWRAAVSMTIIGAGAFLAIPVAWYADRKDSPDRAALFVGTLAVLAFGAIAWGARLADFNMYHVYFGAVAVIATPIAAVAARTVWQRMRETRHARLALGFAILCALQLEFGSIASAARLEQFGPHGDPAVSLKVLEAIKRLPPNAKLAYACQPLRESGFADPTLVSIDAHTGRRVIPMCFQADFLGTLLGAELSDRVMNPSFAWAPQRVLYPNPDANPSSEAVAAFLKRHGVSYIYADFAHPNTLVDSAVPITTDDDAQLLQIP